MGLSPLAALWGVSEAVAQLSVALLASTSLVEVRQRDADGAVTAAGLHDLVRLYVCKRCGDDGMRAAHAALLRGYAARHGVGWVDDEGPGEGQWLVVASGGGSTTTAISTSMWWSTLSGPGD